MQCVILTLYFPAHSDTQAKAVVIGSFCKKVKEEFNEILSNFFLYKYKCQSMVSILYDHVIQHAATESFKVSLNRTHLFFLK